MSRDSAGHGDGMEAVEFVTELLDLVQSPQAFHLTGQIPLRARAQFPASFISTGDNR